MTEEWREIPSLGGRFQASSEGRIRTIDWTIEYKDGRKRKYPGMQRKLTKNKVGHLVFNAGTGYGVIATHTAVAEAFLGPRPEGMYVCHNDGNPLNNAISNLRYDTPSSNILDTVKHGTNYWLARTHCKYGHELTEDNLSRWCTEYRRCLACDRHFGRINTAKYRERRRSEVECQ